MHYRIIEKKSCCGGALNIFIVFEGFVFDVHFLRLDFFAQNENLFTYIQVRLRINPHNNNYHTTIIAAQITQTKKIIFFRLLKSQQVQEPHPYSYSYLGNYCLYVVPIYNVILCTDTFIGFLFLTHNDDDKLVHYLVLHQSPLRFEVFDFDFLMFSSPKLDSFSKRTNNCSHRNRNN